MIYVDRRAVLAGTAATGLFGIPATADAVTNNLAAAADAYAASSAFNGVIVAGTNRSIRFCGTYGLADFAADKRMREDTTFEGGSTSKWIASLVVLRLCDLGRLDLHAPISRYLPDYRADTGNRITLENLLSHSSGLPNQIIPALEANLELYREPIDQAEAVRRYASGDLQFEPGSRWQYSHSNWVVVQQIVERVTGKPYKTLAKELIFAPFKLVNSGIFSGFERPGVFHAISYKSLKRSEPPILIGIPIFMAMIGGYYTDAGDLFHLIDIVRTGRLLTPASRAQLLKVRFPPQRYALGGRASRITINGVERTLMEETGASLGFRTLGYALLESGECVVMLNNVSVDSDDMDATARKLLGLVMQSR